MAIVDLLPFPQSVITHSALKYLQAKVQKACHMLPTDFASLEAWLVYRQETISYLKGILLPWELPQAPKHSVITSMPVGKSLTLEALDIQIEDDFFLTAHLYKPRNSTYPLPAVLVCPGYGISTHAVDTADICIALAKKNIIAIALDYDGSGERAERPDFDTDINNTTAVALLLGVSNVALRVMNNLSVLHHLQNRPDVDATRIGLTGLCQGSIATWFTAAICEDFRAIAPLCGATNYQSIALDYCNRQGGWSGTSPYIHDILNHTDFQLIAACCAPRPLFCQNNIVDLHWPYAGMETVRQLCQKVYALYPNSTIPHFSLEHTQHAYCEPFITNIVDFFSVSL